MQNAEQQGSDRGEKKDSALLLWALSGQEQAKTAEEIEEKIVHSSDMNQFKNLWRQLFHNKKTKGMM